jgi:hypothetical protein
MLDLHDPPKPYLYSARHSKPVKYCDHSMMKMSGLHECRINKLVFHIVSQKSGINLQLLTGYLIFSLSAKLSANKV